MLLPGVLRKVLRLINNRTKAFCSIYKISFVSDRFDISLDFDTSFLKIKQVLTLKIEQKLAELQEDQNVVSHKTSEIFHFGC